MGRKGKRKRKTPLQKAVDKEVRRLERLITKYEKRGFHLKKSAYSTSYTSRNLARLKAKKEADLYKKMEWVDPSTGEVFSREKGEEILALRATEAEMTFDNLKDILDTIENQAVREELRSIMERQIDEFGLTPYLQALDPNKKEIYDNLQAANNYKRAQYSNAVNRLKAYLAVVPLQAQEMDVISQYYEDEAEDVDYE